MAANEKRYRRLVLLHDKLKQIEQSRLARFEGKARELTDEEKRLIEYFNADSFAGLFPDLVMGRIRANREEQSELRASIDKQSVATREQAKRVRQAEVLLETAEARREREDLSEALREILERVAASRKVSAR
jgi:hypothetical protein